MIPGPYSGLGSDLEADDMILKLMLILVQSSTAGCCVVVAWWHE